MCFSFLSQGLMSASETSPVRAFGSERLVEWRSATSPQESVTRWGLAATHQLMLVCFFGISKTAVSWSSCVCLLFFRSPVGFSLWRPCRGNRLHTRRRCRILVWSFAVFLLQILALPGSGESETECWRLDRAYASPFHQLEVLICLNEDHIFHLWNLWNASCLKSCTVVPRYNAVHFMRSLCLADLFCAMII